ncbi:MAG: RNA recognition motif domain-containing protein [Oligoflexales bacterium]
MGNKVFVGSLSWNTDEEGLRQAFSQFGDIQDVRVISDRETGRSRGFGFVTFNDAEDAQKSIEEMDGSDLDGRTIKVNEAKDKPRNSPRGGNGNNRFGDNHSHGNRW